MNEEVKRIKGGIVSWNLIENDCFQCPIAKREGIDVRKLDSEKKSCPYLGQIIKFDKEEKFRSGS